MLKDQDYKEEIKEHYVVKLGSVPGIKYASLSYIYDMPSFIEEFLLRHLNSKCMKIEALQLGHFYEMNKSKTIDLFRHLPRLKWLDISDMQGVCDLTNSILEVINIFCATHQPWKTGKIAKRPVTLQKRNICSLVQENSDISSAEGAQKIRTLKTYFKVDSS